MAEVDGFQFAETERRAVVFPLRAGEPAAGVRLTTEMTLRVRAALVATDASGRRIACDADAPEVTVSERYASATSETPVDKLRLSDDERDLFGSAARDRAYGRLVTGLRDRLADQLARRVAACLDAQVP